jgi:ABC-type phosphate/phosphonate transport system ATPase subunit
MDVQLSNVTVWFPDRATQALSGVTATIRTGEQVALLGPSGAGKSTLVRSLLGAVPARGLVRVDGFDPYGTAAERRAVRGRTGFVRQGGDLVVGVSGRLNALTGTARYWGLRDWARILRGGVPTRFADRLEFLASHHDISDCLASKVEGLSGGQRQRVALVRALLPRRDLLLADEPTAGLDPVSAQAAVHALCAADASTIVVATHDLTVAKQFPRVLALRATAAWCTTARSGLVSVGLYQLECNIRASAVLGFVGAGGLGQEMAISLRLFRYDELSTLVIAVLGLMLIVDAMSRQARRGLGAATSACP